MSNPIDNILRQRRELFREALRLFVDRIVDRRNLTDRTFFTETWEIGKKLDAVSFSRLASKYGQSVSTIERRLADPEISRELRFAAVESLGRNIESFDDFWAQIIDGEPVPSLPRPSARPEWECLKKLAYEK